MDGGHRCLTKGGRMKKDQGGREGSRGRYQMLNANYAQRSLIFGLLVVEINVVTCAFESHDDSTTQQAKQSVGDELDT